MLVILPYRMYIPMLPRRWHLRPLRGFLSHQFERPTARKALYIDMIMNLKQ